MYVEWESPADAESTPGPPWVLVHGGGGQGTDYLTTPDGRLGWSRLLVEQGHTVYVVDRPGHGRSPHHPDVLGPMGPQMGAALLRPIFVPPAEGPDSNPGRPCTRSGRAVASRAIPCTTSGWRRPGRCSPAGRYAGARAGAPGRAARPRRSGGARHPLRWRTGYVPRRRRAPRPGGGADRDRDDRAAVRQAAGDGARPRLGRRQRPADVRPAGGEPEELQTGRRAGWPT